MLLKPTSNEFEIDYPDVHSEFEVQAHLFCELRKMGFDAKGEVQVHGLFGDRACKASCRFDIVVFHNKKASMIIEVKARPVKHNSCVEDTRQGKMYTRFGVPVNFIYGMDEALQFISSMRSEMQGDGVGGPLGEII